MIGKLNLSEKKVTVVGAGVSGLLIGYFLTQKGFEVTILDQSNRVGGLIQTFQTEWGISEAAAHSLLVSSEVDQFFSRLGVPLVEVNHESKARFIYRNGKMRRFPLNGLEIFQLALKASFVRSSTENQSVEDWALRHLGPQGLEYLVAPMVRGIYGCSPKELSSEIAFPAFQVPSGHSLLSYRLFSKKRKRSKMMAPLGGMQSLIDALEAKLKNRIQLNTEIGTVSDSCNWILTVPAYEASKILKENLPELSQALSLVRYTSIVSVTVFIKKSDLMTIPQGIGVLFPPSEDPHILGILFNSSSFIKRTENEDWVSATAMLGSEAVSWTDSQILELITKKFDLLFGLKGQPRLQIYRWRNAIPQYGPDLQKAWKIAAENWCQKPGRVLFGNYTGQVSIRGMIEFLIQESDKMALLA